MGCLNYKEMEDLEYVDQIKDVMIEAKHSGLSRDVIVGRLTDILSEIKEYGWENAMEPIWLKK